MPTTYWGGEPIGGECAYCMGSATELDHVIPRWWGGSDRPSNLVPSCRYCNSSFGASVFWLNDCCERCWVECEPLAINERTGAVFYHCKPCNRTWGMTYHFALMKQAASRLTF